MTETNPLLKNIRQSSGLQLAVLFGSFFIGLLIASIGIEVVNGLGLESERTLSLLAAIFQCVFAFCIPAFLLGKFSSNNPFKWLKLTSKPSLRPFVGVVIVYIISLPAMEWLIEWNQNIQLPESLSGLEATLRHWEKTNEESTKILLQATGLFPILAGVGVIGMLTGFSEELFFRSGLQGILSRSNLGQTTAIWLSAIIFSTMHFQFFGFVPRLIMGAFFGFLLVWTSDVKISAFAHILNNSVVVITAGINGEETLTNPDYILLPDIPYLSVISLISTIIFLVFFRGYFFKSSTKTSILWQKSQLPPLSGR